MESQSNPTKQVLPPSAGNVQLLPDDVASQVAAGEVVERPSSIVKELVENSLDAEATRIDVQYDRGGAARIKVVDNGCGMSRDNALMALERHATSKIRSGEDLAHVATLGFRGEALPSIASVTRMTLASRQHDSLDGTRIQINGGKVESVTASGEPPGTQIEIKALFYNLPARRKFLRSEQTESGHIEQQMQTLALCHYQVAFSLVRDGRQIFQLPAADSLATRVADLFGQDLLRELIELPQPENPNFQVSGLLSKPGTLRSSRASQFFFVNNRAVDARELLYGIREGYGGALPRGRHPVVFLFLQIPPDDVDVNVHPAKREVRFRRPLDIQQRLADVIQNTLATPKPASHHAKSSSPPPNPTTPSTTHTATPSTSTAAPPTNRTPEHTAAPKPQPGNSSEQQVIRPLLPASTPSHPVLVSPEQTHPEATDSSFLPLALLAQNFLLLQDDSGLVVLEINLARQRIHYERILAQMKQDSLHGQQLLMPPVIELPPRQADWLRQRLDLLKQAGVHLEEFGLRSFKLDSLPSFLDSIDPEDALLEIIEDLREGELPAASSGAGQHQLACSIARRATATEPALGLSDAQHLLDHLLDCDLPYCCPQGQPTMIHMSFSELEKRFSS